MKYVPWTKSEIRLLRANEHDRKQCFELLKGRKPAAIIYFAKSLGITFTAKRIPWSEDEISVLHANYANPRLCLALLPRRDGRAIRAKALTEGLNVKMIQSPKLSDDQLAILDLYFPVFGVKVCRVLLPDLSRVRIYNQAHARGLLSPFVKGGRGANHALSKMKPSSLERLYRMYCDEGIDGMKRRFPGMSLEMHQQYFSLLGLDPQTPKPFKDLFRATTPPLVPQLKHRFTTSEDEILKTNFPWAGAMITSWLPGKTLDEITTRAKELKIKGPSARRQGR